jgi:hypothetical protein
MRAVLLSLLLIASANATQWPGVAYSEVRGYAYNAYERGRIRDLVENGKLGPTVVNKAGVRLTARQIDRLIIEVSNRRSGTVDLKTCWSPHHGFVFYDAQGKAVAWVEICFRCGNILSSPPAQGIHHMKALGRLCEELKLPELPKKT